MIEVLEDRKSQEEKAARELKRRILEHLAPLKGTDHLNGILIPSFQCFGQKRKDVDIALALIDSNDQSTMSSTEGMERAFRSLCLTIEVKGHRVEDVSFEGNKCYVRYKGVWHGVSAQSEDQLWSLRGYLKQQTHNRLSIWVDNLIWLNEVPKKLIPPACANILGSDSSWQDFLNALERSTRSDRKVYDVLNSYEYRQFREIAAKKITPTEIDRQKLKTITKSKLREEEQRYFSEFGEKIVAFRGRGGTGKTVRLLQIAHQLWHEKQSRILILTYNRALRSDIERSLIMLGLKGTVGKDAVAIKSIYSFMWHWFRAFQFVLPQGGEDVSDDYSDYEPSKNAILDYLQQGLITSDDVADAKRDKSIDLLWDYVFIDESQDWPENERDLIFRLYGSNNVVIADGVDQLARAPEITNWMERVPTSERRIITLKKSLRMKGRLCAFAELLAEKFDYDVWDLEPDREIHGGTIKLVLGDTDLYSSFRGAIKEANSRGNQTVDNLVCVPPSWSSDSEKPLNFIEELRGVGFKVWDGTSSRADDRDAPATEHDQLRVVSYDSCRGLEGWTTIAVAIDEFFNWKWENPELPSSVKDDLFFADEKADLELLYAVKWLMIPMTRAIDTLYLHVSDSNSVLGKILVELSESNPDLVEIWSSP